MSVISKSLLTDINKAPTVYGALEPVPSTMPRQANYDVAIVGGGLAGLVTALELSLMGKKVVVFEAGRIGANPSGRNGGQLWPGFSMPFTDMCETYGKDTATELWQLAHAVMPRIITRLGQHPSRCGYQKGTFMAAYSRQDARWCAEEAAKMNEAGLRYARFVPAQEMQQSIITSSAYAGGILFDRPYGHFNPLQHVQHLASLLRRSGGEIVEQRKVTHLEQGGLRNRFMVTAAHQSERAVHVYASNVVLAGGAEFNRPKGLTNFFLPTDAVPVQTAILATTPFAASLGKQLFPTGVCFADTRDTGHSYGRVVSCPDGSGQVRLLFGGADALMQSRVSAAFDLARIRHDMHKVFPQLAVHGIDIQTLWGGRESLPKAPVPAVRSLAFGLFSLANFYGQGNTLSALTGAALASQISRKNCRAYDILRELSDTISPVSAFKPLAQLGFAYDLYLKPRLTSLRNRSP